MKLVITNDDGIESRGILTLVERLSSEHEILVVGPHEEKSATSHSVTIHEKILVHEEKVTERLKMYAVEGTPADCVKWAVSESGFKPDWVLSGINRGANTGISVHYSGTVAGAREGAINGISSLAISLCSPNFADFGPSAEWTARLLDFFERSHSTSPWLLNVCVPPRELKEIRGVRVSKQASSRFIEEFIRFDPDQKDKENKTRHYQLAGGIHLLAPDGTGDEEIVREGWVSVTPLLLDQTDYKTLNELRERLTGVKF